MRTERAWAIAATSAGALAFAAQWWGLHPVALTLLALTTWLAVAIRRWGFALGAAAVAVGWMSLILAVLTLTPAVGIDPAIAVGAALVLAIAATIPLVAAVPPAPPGDRVRGVFLASLAGPVLWAGGLAWGLLVPGGGGLSWATYNDSTGAIWLIRIIIQDGGVASLVNLNDAVPLPYALAASLLPPGTVVADASAASVGAQLSAYAWQWSVMIMLASLLSGLVVAALGARRGGRAWPVLAAAAGTSTLLLLAPIAGRLLELGQSNAHVIIVLVAASVLAAAGAERHPALSLSVLLAAMGLLVIAWTPFAAVPAALALLVDRKVKRAGLDRRHVLAWELPGFAVAAWTLVVYGRPLLKSFVATDPDINFATVRTFARPGYWERIGNSYWWPLSIGLCLVAVVLIGLLWRRARGTAAVAALSTAALAAGFLPFVALTRRLPVDLDYYPAKYVSIATICLVPLVVGAALRALADDGRRAARGLVAACLAIACGLAIAAPLPPGTSRWALTPVLIARGEHYGTDAQVAGRLVDYASNDALVLPWRYDPPFDTPVVLMNSAFGPDVDNGLLTPVRYALRFYRNDFGASVACEVADASLVPVVLVTGDAELRGEIAETCPDARITVRYEPVSQR